MLNHFRHIVSCRWPLLAVDELDALHSSQINISGRHLMAALCLNVAYVNALNKFFRRTHLQRAESQNERVAPVLLLAYVHRLD